MNRRLLIFGLCCAALGLALTLTPLFLPVFSPRICQPLYWCGGTVMILGGFLVDVTLLRFAWPVLRRIGRG
jgi:hypothetical protein